MIPKIIHYCWFGGSSLPEYAEVCIESWRTHCPDYEIKQWDESNYNINSNKYTRQAYQSGKWAFVSDVARLDVVIAEGGFYLDVDVELLKPLDELLSLECFVATELFGRVATGLAFGAVPGNSTIQSMRKLYDDRPFLIGGTVFDMTPCPERNTWALLERGYCPSHSIIELDDCTIFPPEFFCPINPVTKEFRPSSNTIGIHHFAGSWLLSNETDNEQKSSRLELLRESKMGDTWPIIKYVAMRIIQKIKMKLMSFRNCRSEGQ